jgi:hypothetical protein
LTVAASMTYHGRIMHSLKALLSGFVDIQPARDTEPPQATAKIPGRTPAAQENHAQEKHAATSARLVPLPFAGQGTIAVEVARFAPRTERYVIKLVDDQGIDVFHITVSDQSVSIELMKDGKPVDHRSEATTTPLIKFPASSMFIWVSVDRGNRRVSFGQGYMMRRNEVVSMQLPEPPRIEALEPAHQASAHTRVWDVHRVEFQSPLAFYKGRAPRVNRMPVVLDAPPVVVDRDESTLEDIALNARLSASMLPDEAQALWGMVSGARIAISKGDANAINYSLNTHGMTLYNIVQRKREHSEFGDPNMVYVRVTIGQAEGDSPGVPFVMEIWPKDSYSPVHNHGNTVAIIKVLHGSITVSWYGPLADEANPEPSPLATQTFGAGAVTWLTPEMYQTHKLKNPLPDTACITIQSYRYLNNDDIHHEYFDYLAPGGGVRRFFEPNSDIDYLEMLRRVREEYDHAIADRSH